MIKTIIADDEIHARERLKDLLEKFDLFDIIAEATDGNEALNLMITHQPTVAFLDINMPGVSVFKSLPSLNTPPIIVFQTAYSEHAAEAFDIDALDYLLKPVRIERLEKTVKKIQRKLNLQEQEKSDHIDTLKEKSTRISVKVNGKTKIIDSNDIIKFSFENGFCYIYTVDGKLMSDKFLNYYEDKLENEGFFRTSRNDIINLKAISAIQTIVSGVYSVELKNGMTVDLSRRRAQSLRKIVDF